MSHPLKYNVLDLQTKLSTTNCNFEFVGSCYKLQRKALFPAVSNIISCFVTVILLQIQHSTRSRARAINQFKSVCWRLKFVYSQSTLFLPSITDDTSK